MKGEKITIKDVAAEAGVSSTTVSMILNGTRTFPEETSRRVIDACNKLGYVRGGLHRNDNIEDKLIIAVVPTFSNYYFVNTVEAMQIRAKNLGYSVMVAETFRERVEEARVLKLCCSLPAAGVILFYPPENSMYLRELEKEKAVIHVYDKGVYEDSSIIEFDGQRVGQLIGDHLLSLGHERIAFLTLGFEMKQVLRVRRLEGLRKAYTDKGYKPDESVLICTQSSILPNVKRKLDGYDLGFAITKELIRRNENITALACLNDMIAIGSMDAIIDSGKKVPNDYSVCGCDNINIANYKGINLTTVDGFTTKTGQDAIDILITELEENSMSDRSGTVPRGVTRIEYYPRLIIRNSTGPRKA